MGESKRRKKLDPNYGKRCIADFMYEYFLKTYNEPISLTAVVNYQARLEETLTKDEPFNFLLHIQFKQIPKQLLIRSQLIEINRLIEFFPVEVLSQVENMRKDNLQSIIVMIDEIYSYKKIAFFYQLKLSELNNEIQALQNTIQI